MKTFKHAIDILAAILEEIRTGGLFLTIMAILVGGFVLACKFQIFG